MKRGNLGKYISGFFTQHLQGAFGVSDNTLASYRQTFSHFFSYMRDSHGLKPEALNVTDVNARNIIGFLDWLKTERSNSDSTRHHRQAVLRSFVQYLKYEYPDGLDEFQKILAMPMLKVPEKEIPYLQGDGVNLLLSMIDSSTPYGFRDYVIVLLLYTTGIRVSELIGVRGRDLCLEEPATMLVHGKGSKSRYVPLLKKVKPVIVRYLNETGRGRAENLTQPLFQNHQGNALTRQGVNYILKKYTKMAREKDDRLIPVNMSSHKMRHTCAMELVNSGVDLIYIRDLLGHASVTTTERYAKADSKHKRQAIEAVSKDVVPPQDAVWSENKELREWLKQLGL